MDVIRITGLNDTWRLVIVERADAAFSHMANVRAIREAPRDPLDDGGVIESSDWRTQGDGHFRKPV